MRLLTFTAVELGLQIFHCSGTRIHRSWKVGGIGESLAITFTIASVIESEQIVNKFEQIHKIEMLRHFDSNRNSMEMKMKGGREGRTELTFPLANPSESSPTFFDGRFRIATHEIKWGERSHCRLYFFAIQRTNERRRRRGFGIRLIRIKPSLFARLLPYEYFP